MSSNLLYLHRVDELVDIVDRLHRALEAAGIDYQVVGGMAVFLHVEAKRPELARTTQDVDIAIRRSALLDVKEAVEPFGFKLRHAAGIDLLVDTLHPEKRNRVQFVFFGEKVRPEYVTAVPESPALRTKHGYLIASVRDLLVMKLTSYRLKDQVHVQDLDRARLITPEIVAALPELLRSRLTEIRAAR